MPGKQAKILSTDHIDDLLFFAEKSRSPLRNRLIVLLSTKAGLRAGEIAKLIWDMEPFLLDVPATTAGRSIQIKIHKPIGGTTMSTDTDRIRALNDEL